jgi:hypothetical protein
LWLDIVRLFCAAVYFGEFWNCRGEIRIIRVIDFGAEIGIIDLTGLKYSP